MNEDIEYPTLGSALLLEMLVVTHKHSMSGFGFTEQSQYKRQYHKS